MLVQEATPQSTGQISPAQIGTDGRPPAAPSANREASFVAPVVTKDRSGAAKGAGESAERNTSPQEIEAEPQALEDKSSRARLNFDADEHRVFIEIVDPKTGDVITRFPPEQISDHIDSVLEQTDQKTNLEDAGLIVDQSV